MAGKFKVIKASAGSGKTYTLVKEYLQLVLVQPRPDYYRHILAVTFTNAAAAEMKERVLNTLQKLSKGPTGHASMFGDMKEALQLSDETLSERAAGVFKHMLHHYGQISITTIDSFTHRLVRTFARELRVGQDFDVQMDSATFIAQLTNLCIEQTGKDQKLTDYLRQYVLQQLDEESDWNMRDTLEEFIRDMLSEEAYHALKKIEDLHIQHFAEIRKSLYERHRAYTASLQQVAAEVWQRYHESGLAISDFYRGGSGNLTQIRDLMNGKIESQKKVFVTTYTEDKWYSAKISVTDKAILDSLVPWLKERFEKIASILTAENFAKHELRKLVLKNLFATGLMNKLNELAQVMKSDQNILLIKDFHELIHGVLSENDAPFIFERLGIRYKHILFDEFQDTSALQWSNARPLMENSLSEDNLCLIVGDGKQSIYRWRGARSEQFVSLPHIAELQPHETDTQQQFSTQYTGSTLQHNYRSATGVVQFNNQFYALLSARIAGSDKVYANHEQLVVKPGAGYVQVQRVNTNGGDDSARQMLAEVRDAVEQCISDGFRPCDIAVLTRKGPKEASVIAADLHDNGYGVVTKESFLLRNSAKVKAIMGYLCYMAEPANSYVAVECARNLCSVHHYSFEHFVSDYISLLPGKRKSLVRLSEWLATLHKPVPESLSGNGFEIAVALIRYFRFETDTYIEHLLDALKQRTTQAHFTLPQLAVWWQSSQHKLYISSIADADAIQVMTIHRSKGLQFPVVIYPRFDSRHKPNKMWISIDESEYGLPTALVSTKTMDEQFSEFWPAELKAEKRKETLDELNLCYVATTRAEQRLYLIHEVRKAMGTELRKVIDEVLEKNLTEWKQNENTWLVGQTEKNENQPQLAKAETISHRHVQTARFRTRHATLLDEEKQLHITYGNVLHRCLAGIVHADDAAAQIAAASSGLPDFLQQQLERDVMRIVRHEKYAACFATGTTVFAERELTTTDGRILRPDRVCKLNNCIHVLDYKTSAPHALHTAQLDEYVSTLREIFQTEVRGDLVYVNAL
ncbi:MAG: UvrD-helicase domain-containing protein [Flavobacteriales bacterium]